MNMGVQRAEAPEPIEGAAPPALTREPGDGNADSLEWIDPPGDEREALGSPSGDGGRRWLAVLLSLAAVGWAAAVAWALSRETDLAPAQILQWIALASAPLILLGLTWQIFGRTSRREAERFSRAVAAMHAESAALETLLTIVASRIEENHGRLTGEATKLMSLGDEASDRLGRVTHYLSRESRTLDAKAQALEAAAAAARVDIGVLLQDLPRAEEQARALAATLRDTGHEAHGQAGALESQVAALSARAREADEITGGAAQRLAAHIARIETSAGAAVTRISEAADGIGATIDETMARAAEAFDMTRSGIEQQGAAVLAAIEQSSAAFERAGDATGRSVRQRLEAIDAQLGSIAGVLAAQDAASAGLMARLQSDVAALDQGFGALGARGEQETNRLGEGVAALRGAVAELSEAMAQGEAQAAQLEGQAGAIGERVGEIGQRIDQDLTQALGRLDIQAREAGATAATITPQVEAAEASAATAAARLSEAEASTLRQREALQGLLGIVADGVAAAEAGLQQLAAAVGEADEAAARLSGETGPRLIEALVRVRETAQQAAGHAREAIASAIPESSAAFVAASRKAVGEAVTQEVTETVNALNRVAEQAVETSRAASENLTRQMLAIGSAAGAVEERLADARREREEREGDAFSRRTALLIESLNSTAIDVTKILSNEVTDGTWQAYLKGDRGAFTRRAVRLLDAAEVREILQHYDSEPEFRDQVNRYIADFEAMLRRVVEQRDGSALAVTLLSSDMGKLYVALAQAIERLRV